MNKSESKNNGTERFGKEICETNPLVSIVLSAHLRIEAQADRLLRIICKKPKVLKTTRLSVSQKFLLCEAFFGDPNDDVDFWQAPMALNRLRNEIAHGLSQEKFEKKLRDFISTIAEDERDSVGQELQLSLVNCLMYLFDDLSRFEEFT